MQLKVLVKTRTERTKSRTESNTEVNKTERDQINE